MHPSNKNVPVTLAWLFTLPANINFIFPFLRSFDIGILISLFNVLAATNALDIENFHFPLSLGPPGK